MINMENLFLINEEEKNRILNLHESATKRHYLSEQPMLDLGQPSQPEIGPQLLQNTSGTVVKQGIPPDPYVYAKMGNNYYYSKDTNTDTPNWTLAVKEKAINAIKSKIFNQEIPVNKTIIPPKKEDGKKKTNVVLSKKISPTFKSSLDTTKLSTTNSVKIFKAGQDNCAQFVKEFINGLPKPGDAWIAHDNSSLGTTVWSAFTKLPIDTRNNIINLWKKIDKKGGGTEKGPYMNQAKSIVSSLVPNSSGVNLQLNDIIGLYYPGSKHHEEAFYQGGKIFFKKDANGNPIAGNTIKGGTGWGMNTHLGVVGAIDNGTPIIFHNIGGQVYADPYTNIKGGSKIAWVKRA